MSCFNGGKQMNCSFCPRALCFDCLPQLKRIPSDVLMELGFRCPRCHNFDSELRQTPYMVWLSLLFMSRSDSIWTRVYTKAVIHISKSRYCLWDLIFTLHLPKLMVVLSLFSTSTFLPSVFNLLQLWPSIRPLLHFSFQHLFMMLVQTLDIMILTQNPTQKVKWTLIILNTKSFPVPSPLVLSCLNLILQDICSGIFLLVWPIRKRYTTITTIWNCWWRISRSASIPWYSSSAVGNSSVILGFVLIVSWYLCLRMPILHPETCGYQKSLVVCQSNRWVYLIIILP